MKLNALTHPKTLHLCALLNVTRPTAIGHLELLWAFTGEMAAQGNIGKWPDGAISRACEWMGEPESFLQSLLQSGFIDRHPQHRYVIHDWSDHAPRWVRAKLAKASLSFIITPARTVERTTVETDDVDDDTAEGTAGASSKGSEVKRREGKGSTQTRGGGSAAGKGKEGPTERNRESRAFDPAGDSAAFALVKASYPKFAGRQNWIQAEHYCHLRLDDGTTWDDLIAGADRYAKHIRALGKEGTQHVIRPENFFNAPDRPWSQEWELPAEQQQPKPLNGTRRLTPIEIIEREILAGRSDDEIAAMHELELWPTVRDDIRNMRQEIAGA